MGKAATEILKKSLDLLFINNPQTLGISILLGGSIKFLVTAFAPILKTMMGIDPSEISGVYYICLAIFIGYLISHFETKKLDEEIELELKKIEVLLNKGAIDKEQARLQYLKIIEETIVESIPSKADVSTSELASSPNGGREDGK